MTTNTNPKAVRLALNEAGIDTAKLDIVPSSHGVLISTLTETQADATLMVTVHMTLAMVKGLDDITRRGPFILKINNQRRRR